MTTARSSNVNVSLKQHSSSLHSPRAAMADLQYMLQIETAISQRPVAFHSFSSNMAPGLEKWIQLSA